VGRTYFDFYFMIVACVAILRQVCREEWAASADSEEDLAASNVPQYQFSTMPVRK